MSGCTTVWPLKSCTEDFEGSDPAGSLSVPSVGLHPAPIEPATRLGIIAMSALGWMLTGRARQQTCAGATTDPDGLTRAAAAASSGS